MYRRLAILSVFFVGALACHADTARPLLEEAAEAIDRQLAAAWQRAGVKPADPSTDVEFHRRLWLDIAGVAPSVAQTRRFLNDSTADKRQRLIDRLLASPQFANHMATRWTNLLLPADSQNLPPQQSNVDELHRWLRERFTDNIPYDHLVGRFLTAGGAGNRGPAIFYTARNVEPKKVAAATSKIFMGIQLQCAECHDHPFDRWTMEDFWQYTAFFGQLAQSDAEMNQGGIVEDRVGGEVRFPDSEKIAVPMYPGVDQPPDADPTGIRRRQLTIWLASRDNPYFVRAAVNRTWHHLFGRGLVEPVDAMDEANKPSHPELLDFLADYFVEIQFDLRTLYATLARTKAYQLTSRIDDAASIPPDSFAAMSVKTLTAAQFYDSLRQNVLRQSASDPYQNSRRQFISRMSAGNASPTDYPQGVVQVLGIMNGPELTNATDTSQIGLLAMLEAPFINDVERIETLFLSTLSRFPSSAERAQFLAHVKTAADQSNAWADLLWVLLNTSEFAVAP